MRHHTRFNLLFLLVILGAITQVADAVATPNYQTDKNSIHVSKKIPSGQRELIHQDLEFLKTVSLWKDFDLKDSLETDIKEGSPDYIKQWLNERVSYIVPQVNNRSLPIFQSQMPGSYPLSEAYPKNVHTMFLVEDSFANAIMANIGTSFYLLGKQTNQTLSIKTKEHFPLRVPFLAVPSPRVGLIEVYSAFFKPELSLSGKGNQPGDRILRLSYLFHEGRHSDGNGNTLGFFHAECPVGHDYAGRYACDTPSNGSYKVGAVFLRHALEACHACSESNKEALRLAYFDSRNRILDRPILTPKMVDELNDLQNQMNSVINKIFSQMNKLTDDEKNGLILQIEELEEKIFEIKNPESMAKVYWNSAPEGLEYNHEPKAD